jgi:hypothetical protein
VFLPLLAFGAFSLRVEFLMGDVKLGFYATSESKVFSYFNVK